MSKLDAVKEVLNSLRAALNVITAFLIALGGAMGALYNAGNVGALFWVSAVLMSAFILAGFITVMRIKQKTKEIEEL
jgi:hypothetical protein